MSYKSEGLEEIAKRFLNIKQATSLEDARKQAEIALENIATNSIQNADQQRFLKELFKSL